MSFYDPPLENRNPEEHLLMDFNEPPLPPPKEVIDKIAHFLKKRAHAYPVYGDFLEVLSKYTGASQDSLLLTNGSDQAIDVILRVYWKVVRMWQWFNLDLQCLSK